MTLVQDLRYAVRMLLKDPWFTMVAATALGLGIGVNTTVFTFVNAVLIRGLPFDQSHELVFLATGDTTRDDDGSPASWQELEEWRAKTRSFSGLAAFRPQQMNVSDPDHPAERVSGASVTANTFGLLRQQPFLGRDFAAGEDAAGAAARRDPRVQRLEESLRQRPWRDRPHASRSTRWPTRSSA